MEKIVFALTNRGFFSELNNFLLAIHYAETKGAEFCLDDRGWIHAAKKGFKLYYRNSDINFWNKWFPIRSIFHDSLPIKIQKFLVTSVDDSIKYPSDYFDEMSSLTYWKSYYGEEKKNEEIFYYMFKKRSELAKKFLVLNDETNKKIQILLDKIPEVSADYCAVHIRGGDKLSTGEMGSIPLDWYANAITNQKYNDICVFTDSGVVFSKLKSLVSVDKNLILISSDITEGYDQNKFNQYDDSRIIQETLQLILEIKLILNSKFLICTFSSNLSRFAALYLGLPKCKSLDSIWHPF